MLCIVHCAKDGERLGCVLSSRVPGRRDALHEHALKSCAANNGFSAKLEFDIFFGNGSHVSPSFYGFMLHD